MTLVLAMVLAAQPELGIVKWSRGFDAAAARAKAEHKPLLVLFDEVPGCSTVVGFGERVLSHPLVADAIEHELVGVFVSNNTGGDDRRVLERFQEPPWNNPVLRLFSPEGKQLARLDTPALPEVARALAAALQQSGRAVPSYLQLLVDEQAATARHKDYAMGCFWEGESSLGKLPSVTGTQTGFVDGREAVRVWFGGDSIALDAAARSRGYAEVQGDFRAAPSDDKHALQQGRLRFVPMTPLQKTRLNASPGEAEQWLSPRQLALLSSGAVEVLGIDDVVEAFRVSERRRTR
jgi:hypothetical protein